MRFLYVSSIYYPSQLANRLQTVYMSIELSKILGNNFFLGVSKMEKDDWVRQISNIIIFKNTKSYLLAWEYLSFIKKNKINIVFSREIKLLFLIIILNKTFFHLDLVYVFEEHNFPKHLRFYHKFVYSAVDKLTVITGHIKEKFLELGLPENKILVSPDGVDLDFFDVDISKIEARKKLNLPLNKKIIMYAGSLGFYHDWKGVDLLIEVSEGLSADQIVVLVGGEENQEEKLKKDNSSNSKLLFTGFQKRDNIPFYLKAADLLVLPNKKGRDISEKYTSPLKMFEYMASGRPIVAADLPSIREVLDERTAYFFEPNNVDSLKKGIEHILSNELLGESLSSQALNLVKQKYTWKERANNLIESLK